MTVGICSGNGDDHCCYQNNAPCKYLEQHTVPGRRWACGLLRELGDWDTVLASDRYQQDVAPHWEDSGLCCKTFPLADHRCVTCGHGCS